MNNKVMDNLSACSNKLLHAALRCAYNNKENCKQFFLLLFASLRCACSNKLLLAALRCDVRAAINYYSQLYDVRTAINCYTQLYDVRAAINCCTQLCDAM